MTVVDGRFVSSTVVTGVTSSVVVLFVLRRFSIFLRSSRSRVPNTFVSVRDTELVRTLLAMVMRSPRLLLDDRFLRVRTLVDVLVFLLLSHRPGCVNVVRGYLVELR